MKKRKLYIAEHENGIFRNSEADSFTIHTEKLSGKNQKMVEISIPTQKPTGDIILIFRDPDTDFELTIPIKHINKLRIDRDDEITITWSVDDFEQRATELEEDAETIFPLYDRTKFLPALKAMLHKHDYNIGIAWSEVEYYLNTMCLLPLPETEPIQP